MKKNTMKKTYLAAVASASLLVLGGIGTANAVPSYGYAYLGFTNFTLSGISPADGVSFVVAPTVTVSAASDYLGGGTPGHTSVGGNLVTGATVLQSTAGPGGFPGENVFTQQLLASSGTRGDGDISGPIGGGGAISNLVAEGRLTSQGSANSSSGSTTTITALFTVATGTLVTLSFNAIADLFASVGQAGDSASAQLSASYSITQILTAAGAPVNIPITVGGDFVAANSAIGNRGVSAQIPGLVDEYHLASTPYSLTATLAPGTYRLNLQDNVRVQLEAVVPEPASLGILGVGLLALGMVTRRRPAI